MHQEPLRIAFATPEYATEKYFDGGLANYLHRVAKALAARGHDVHVVTFSEIDEAEFQHEGVTIHRILSRNGLRRFNRWTRYHLATTMFFLDFSVQVYQKLKQINAREPLHLVQFPNYSSCGLVSTLFLRVPHVLRASSYQLVYNDIAGIKRTLDIRMVEWLEELQFRWSLHVYTPSHTLQRILEREAHLPHVKVIRPPFYLENQHWDASVYDQSLKGKQYLLFFGRFGLLKGFHILAQALPRFLERYPDAHAVLAGRDLASPLAPSMAEYARAQCGCFANRLIVLEKLPHDQLYPIIAGAHLVVLPSLIENFPNACLEAMSLGKAVIGTLGASFDELIRDEVNGFLVTPNDAEALAEKIIQSWTHPKLGEIGAAAPQKILEFAPERTVETLLAYYREVLRERSGPCV